ncbi:MAG: 3D-(3,5/4)-trihydroxycyclohexane-1,2-dione acylhydrolase (decyclizing) [Gulosibacter sp.]|uniref:3D-(3,5/4)-trihydroxycyclohexane-1,2-dione acylhydrolase (decyclizing) n=1 Tax=Gulosibacter sp. TaxID=2817531 RepID=UPI003F8E7B2C
MTSTSYPTVRLTVGQAIIKFLQAQYVERDGETQRFFGGGFGIFGHGNVGGLGQAMLEYEEDFPYYQGRSEQGMVHIGIGYAKVRNRLGALAVSTSIGPGATNMVTGAGTASVNHLPVLLFPSDVFANRATGAVLQQQEMPYAMDVTANDSFRAVSRYFDRIWRPEQLASALLEAMRVLTSPADTGAVTIALPQDVQAEAYDFPEDLFRDRVWHVPRNRADRAAIKRAADVIRAAKRAVIISGGGVIYSEASEQLVRFAESTGIGVGVTQAGKASFPHEHELALGALGASGTKFANAAAQEADVVIGIGTRYTDFTTASNTLFQNPDVKFVNINVAEIDAYKEAATALIGDAQVTIDELLEELGDWSIEQGARDKAVELASGWREENDRIIALDDSPTLSQAQMLGILNAAAGERDVVVNAAGSMPGDLHRLWRPGSTKGYDIEYGNSCMGYEIPGAIGNAMGDSSRHVFGLIGDGTFLMLSSELLTAVQEKLKLTIVIVNNYGYGSIGALSETVGSQAFGTRFNERGDSGVTHDGPRLEVDFAQNAESYGAKVWKSNTAETFAAALEEAKAYEGTSVVYVEVDSQARFGGSGAWWEVAVPEVSELESTIEARKAYDEHKKGQRLYL